MGRCTGTSTCTATTSTSSMAVAPETPHVGASDKTIINVDEDEMDMQELPSMYGNESPPTTSNRSVAVGGLLAPVFCIDGHSSRHESKNNGLPGTSSGVQVRIICCTIILFRLTYF